MKTGNATMNQKVFITLGGYTRLVNEYHRTVGEIQQARQKMVETGGKESLSYNTWIARKSALDFVFRTLELPMENLSAR